MGILSILLVLVAGVPSELYESYCSKEKIDSLYAGFSSEAQLEYDRDAQAAASYYMADWAYNASLVELSDYFLDLAMGSDIEDQVLRADCLSLASSISRLKGNMAEAISYAEACLQIDRESGSQENVSSSLNNIAGMYLTYGDATTARKYIDESIVIEKQLGRNSNLAIRYGVASEIYTRLGELEQALEYADMAFQIDSLDARIGKIAVRRSQKGAVLMAMGRYDEAQAQLVKAYPVFKEQNSLSSLSITCAQLGDIAAANGNINGAIHYYEESILHSGTIGNIYIESRAARGLYLIYKNLDVVKALANLERCVELDAQIHNDKAGEMMQSFNVMYDTLKKENTILVQQHRIRYASIILVILIVLSAVSIVLAIVKYKAARVMEEKNAMLVKSNLDKDRLLALTKHNLPNEVSEEITSIVSDVKVMPDINLTRRELQIAELCSLGKLNKEIATELGISQRTVETHKNNLFRKLGINNTVELMRYMQWYQNH
ncbi:MAG: hypothetical protein II989_05600 [Bacteroidales bacterium]|nr:hypothetical protein [Bacteroidales bacterium]